jgi:ribonuclease P protein component
MTSRSPQFTYVPEVRLKKSWEFDAVFRAGRRQWGELVRICYLYRENSPVRVGVAVGKKIANSVGRSRGRRMLRESFRRLIPWIEDGVWIVAMLRECALSERADAVYRDAALILKRSGLLSAGWGGSDWRCDSCGSRTCREDAL